MIIYKPSKLVFLPIIRFAVVKSFEFIFVFALIQSILGMPGSPKVLSPVFGFFRIFIYSFESWKIMSKGSSSVTNGSVK